MKKNEVSSRKTRKLTEEEKLIFSTFPGTKLICTKCSGEVTPRNLKNCPHCGEKI